ncbi:hypothetical protein Efla_007213 [Eimeria flavescens]
MKVCSVFIDQDIPVQKRGQRALRLPPSSLGPAHARGALRPLRRTAAESRLMALYAYHKLSQLLEQATLGAD